MEDVWTVVNFAMSHWPFLACVLGTMVIGQFMKETVWRKQLAYAKGRMQWFWWWGYKSMALHGAAACMLFVAPFWEEPAPGITSLIAREAYFGVAGLVGVAGFRIFKELAQKRGIDLTLPGLEEEQQTTVTVVVNHQSSTKVSGTEETTPTETVENTEV